MKKINVFNMYFCLLMFNIMNKTFEPFGIDLRVICVAMGIVLIIMAIKNDCLKILADKYTKLLLGLYAFVLIGFFNLHVDIVRYDDYLNLVVLNLYNLFHIIVIAIYRKHLNNQLCKRAIEMSLLFLGCSILLTVMGLELPFNAYENDGAIDNLFGIKRYTGYGTDPNYVSVLFACFMFAVCEFEENKKYRFFWYVFCISMIWFSKSTTVIVVLFLLAIVNVLFKCFNSYIKKIILGVTIIGIVSITLFMIKSQILSEELAFNQSMSIRLGMWSRAITGFYEHPMFGNGLASVRNISYNLSSRWYVQCHSTFFQLLCENGIFAVMIYIYIFYYNMRKNIGNSMFNLFLLYFIWSFTYETMYLSFTILFLAVFPYWYMGVKKEEQNAK